MQNVKTDTIVRTIALIVALTNQVLTMFGKSLLPFDNEEVTTIATTIITTITSLWAWWKNNSFTKNAIEADKVLDELKKGKAEDEA